MNELKLTTVFMFYVFIRVKASTCHGETKARTIPGRQTREHEAWKPDPHLERLGINWRRSRDVCHSFRAKCIAVASQLQIPSDYLELRDQFSPFNSFFFPPLKRNFRQSALYISVL